MTRKAVDLALSGDRFALRLCLERIVPQSRERTVEFRLPAMRDLDDGPKAIAALLAAVANGELTPAEASELLKLVDAFTRAIGAKDRERRENLERPNGTPRIMFLNEADARL